ncbi:MAG: helix-turn-helix transcriptional regulator [Piscirickettsiaceae bacterium]|jgi:DNA-binding Xre family transcriptional regulator|nr:helix-turn-helix transcriptional regulator [Piscirickettsiaceae bacterium]
MAQTAQLMSVLKQSLKLHGFSYRDVAQQLNLSEASVKRLFSANAFSLVRLDSVCQMMGLEISDLVAEMNQQTKVIGVSKLTEKEEEELAADPVLLLVTVCVLNGWTLVELTEHYHLNPTQCVHYLATLDRLKLITLLPMNHIQLCVTANFTWRKNGPIQQFFQDKLAADFFDTGFDRDHEQLTVINGMLTESDMIIFQRKCRQLVQEFEELNHEARSLPLPERKGMTIVLAARNWQYGLFDDIRKSTLIV